VVTQVAMYFAYLGVGYHGMQRNPGVWSVEDELEKAISAAGGISADNKGDFSKIHWTRAARTDKGVSAVGQLVALKCIVDPPGLVDRINAALPSTFRCFGITRVTNGFNAKNLCDKRRCGSSTTSYFSYRLDSP
jgi:tRNA pseudouridine38-40 synthase